MTSTLISNILKAWHFLYKRGFIEGFGHISARLPDSDQFLIARHSLGPTATAEDFLGQTAADAGGELLKNRGPFRRVWALVESDAEESGMFF